MTQKVCISKPEFDTSKLVETDEFLDIPTVFVREGIFPYKDGRALKPADELRDGASTLDGAFIVAKSHVPGVFVTERRAIRGRAINVKFCGDINGIIGTSRFFKKTCDAPYLEAVRKGQLKDVSLGFFFEQDMTPGKFKEQAYDYVQRNFLFGHVAAGVAEGRCPSPYCGMTVADAMRQAFDPEETENFIRVPVAEGEVVATITLSKSEGITALIGRKDGKSFIITYLFAKDKDWTMEKAKAWVKDHKEAGDAVLSVSELKVKILELGTKRQKLMDELYPPLMRDDKDPARAAMSLEVSVIDVQIRELTEQLAEKAVETAGDENPEAPEREIRESESTPEKELARARTLLGPITGINIERKTLTKSR